MVFSQIKTIIRLNVAKAKLAYYEQKIIQIKASIKQLRSLKRKKENKEIGMEKETDRKKKRENETLPSDEEPTPQEEPTLESSSSGSLESNVIDYDQFDNTNCDHQDVQPIDGFHGFEIEKTIKNKSKEKKEKEKEVDGWSWPAISQEDAQDAIHTYLEVNCSEMSNGIVPEELDPKKISTLFPSFMTFYNSWYAREHKLPLNGVYPEMFNSTMLHMIHPLEV